MLRRLTRLLQRGRHAGEFDSELSPEWLVTAIFALGHAAGDAVGAGGLDADEAIASLRHSVLRIVGATGRT